MPTPEAIASEKERLYESSSLRDDLNDSEATVLLEWGQTQIDRLAEEFPEEFEKKARFMRQLLKNINRFVGQREFNEREGQEKYMKKITQYLEPLGWMDIDDATFFIALPDDKTDMAANLSVILDVLSPSEANIDDDSSDEPVGAIPTLGGGLPVVPTLSDTIGDILENLGANDVNDTNEIRELEKPNTHSINQSDDVNSLGEQEYYGEE